MWRALLLALTLAAAPSKGGAAPVLTCKPGGMQRSSATTGTLAANPNSLNTAQLAPVTCTFVVGSAGAATALTEVIFNADVIFTSLVVYGKWSHSFFLICLQQSVSENGGDFNIPRHLSCPQTAASRTQRP